MCFCFIFLFLFYFYFYDYIIVGRHDGYFFAGGGVFKNYRDLAVGNDIFFPILAKDEDMEIAYCFKRFGFGHLGDVAYFGADDVVDIYVDGEKLAEVSELDADDLIKVEIAIDYRAVVIVGIVTLFPFLVAEEFVGVDIL